MKIPNKAVIKTWSAVILSSLAAVSLIAYLSGQTQIYQIFGGGSLPPSPATLSEITFGSGMHDGAVTYYVVPGNVTVQLKVPTASPKPAIKQVDISMQNQINGTVIATFKLDLNWTSDIISENKSVYIGTLRLSDAYCSLLVVASYGAEVHNQIHIDDTTAHPCGSGLVGPDYIINTVTVRPATTKVGTLTTIITNIKNIGNANGGSRELVKTRAQFIAPYGVSVTPLEQTDPALNINTSNNLEMTWTPDTPGDYEIHICTDPNNEISELDEDNNCKIRTFTIEPATAPKTPTATTGSLITPTPATSSPASTADRGGTTNTTFQLNTPTDTSLNAPTNLTGTVWPYTDRGSQFRMNWTDNSDNEEYFKFEVKEKSKDWSSAYEPYTEAINITTKDIRYLSSNTIYDVRMRAQIGPVDKPTATSKYSETVRLKTLDVTKLKIIGGSPSSPSNSTLTIGENSIKAIKIDIIKTAPSPVYPSPGNNYFTYILKSINLKIPGDFPLDKLYGERLFVANSGNEVDGVTFTKSPSKDILTINFPDNYEIKTTEPKSFELYVTADVGNDTPNSSFHYSIDAVDTAPLINNAPGDSPKWMPEGTQVNKIIETKDGPTFTGGIGSVTSTPAQLAVKALAPPDQSDTLQPNVKTILKLITLDFLKSEGSAADQLSEVTFGVNPSGSTTTPPIKNIVNEIYAVDNEGVITDLPAILPQDIHGNSVTIGNINFALKTGASQLTFYSTPDIGITDSSKTFQLELMSIKTTPEGMTITKDRDAKLGKLFTVAREIPGAPLVYSFTTPSLSIARGTTIKISWDVEDVTKLSIDHDVSRVHEVIGGQEQSEAYVTPMENITYTLNAWNEETAADPKQLSITVTDPTPVTPLSGGAPAINSFQPSTTSITPGGSATLTWNVSNASGATVTIDHSIGVVSPSSSIVVRPTETTKYKISATKGSQTVTSETTVFVTATPGPTPPPVLTCEQQGKFAFTGRVKFHGKTKGMCIDCATNVFVRNNGVCLNEKNSNPPAPAPTPNPTPAPTPFPTQTPVSRPVGNDTNIAAGTSTSDVSGTSANVDLSGTGRLHGAPDKSETGPETLIYLIPIAVASGLQAWKKRRRKR